MFEILALGWAEILSVLVLFAITSGLMLEIYSIFTPSNPSLWYGSLVILPIAGILTAIIHFYTSWIDYLSFTLLGVYEGQGYLLWAGLCVLLVVLLVDILYSWGGDWFSDRGSNYSMTGKGILSICQVGFIVLLLIGPGYLANHLEKIETSSGDIISFSSETSGDTSPYWEFNSETLSPNGEHTDGFNYLQSEIYIDPTVSMFNVDGYWDYSMTDQNMTGFVLLELWSSLDPNLLILDDMMEVSIGINCPLNYSIHSVQVKGLNFDYTTGSTWGVGIPSSFGDVYSGLHYYNTTWDIVDLGEGAGEVGAYPISAMVFRIQLEDGYLANTLVETDLQITPEYVTESTVNTTTYEPYILTYSNNFIVYQWCFGVGGVLLMVGSVILLPWIRISKWMKKALGVGN